MSSDGNFTGGSFHEIDVLLDELARRGLAPTEIRRTVSFGGHSVDITISVAPKTEPATALPHGNCGPWGTAPSQPGKAV